MPLFIECSLHQNGNTQGVHSDDKLFLPPSPQVTCQATDIRSVIGKWISHLLLYRWVCKEPFYIAYIACYNAVAFFFFLPSGYSHTLAFGSIFQLLAVEAHASSVPATCWAKTWGKYLFLFVFQCPNKKYIHTWAGTWSTMYTSRSANLNHQGLKRVDVLQSSHLQW